LFLAYAADLTGNDQQAALARDVVEQVVSRLDILTAAESSEGFINPGAIGAFGPLGGAVYAMAHIGALWGDQSLLDVADRIVGCVDGVVPTDPHLDIISGASGLIMALAAIERARPGGPSLGVMRRCAERLLATATPRGDGIAWQTRLDATQPLTGFSHGASGMAVGLVTAGAVLGESRYVDAALAAMRYERSTLDSAAANWPDYRILDRGRVPEMPSLMWSWCHGAPGIGLARLVTLQHTRDANARGDLDIAIASTVANGFFSNDSLCHGDLGNLELLLRAREDGFGGAWEATLAAEASRLVERLARGEWRCGIPGGVETPGLMMGLAGIGYGILRLGATERIPSLLSLEAPRRAAPRGES